MNTKNNTAPLPQWSDYVDVLSEAQALVEQWPGAQEPQQRQELYRLMFAALATGYQTAFASADAPDFVPAVSNLLNTIGANPDFIYAYTRIDGSGTYRVSGVRGDELFILLDLTAGGFGVLDQFGPSVGCIDFDELQIADDGSFDLLLSAEKPKDYDGDWFYLDPATQTGTLRKGYYQWGEGTEARISIERLDSPMQSQRLSAEAVAHRLKLLSGYITRYVQFILGYGLQQRQQGYVNRLQHDDWAGKGGVVGQHYFQGIFELQPGEVMLIETSVPETVRYWNIQVNDALWNTIDWFNHQSSLNASQAQLDEDGKFRAVISPVDPGVPNWLDTGGHLQGSLMLRWMGADSAPEPEVRIVNLDQLREQLPASTKVVSVLERQQALRERNRRAQLRRRW